MIAPDLQVGFLVPGATYPAWLRFSNAGALVVSDRENDLRGLAAKVVVSEGVSQDFLGTNAEVHHAKDAVEALWTSYLLYQPGPWAKLTGIARLMLKFGWGSGRRIVRTLSAQIRRPVLTLASETFWSRSPLRIGEVVGRYRLRAEMRPEILGTGQSSLGADLASWVSWADVHYSVELQRYQDEALTPLEDSTVPWSTPFELLGRLTIPQGANVLDLKSVETMSFSPWNTAGADFEPLGNLNRARKPVYFASQRARS